MRQVVRLALTISCTLVPLGPSRAEDKEALAVVQRAIKAHGGEAKLARASTCTRSEAGVLFRPDKGADVKFTATVVRNLPDQVRRTIDLGPSLRTVLVLNGDKGWVRSGGPAEAMVKDYRNELREQAYRAWLGTLVPLKQPAFTLKALPDAKVHDEPAAVVRVSHKGHADATLYFIKGSGLLVKIAQRTPEAGVVADREYLFGAFKEFDGVKLPTQERVFANGKKQSETTVTAYNFLTRIDPAEFTRP